MKKIVIAWFNLLLMSVISFPLLAQEVCSVDADTLGAHYTRKIISADQKNVQEVQFELWRNGGQVAHVHPQNKITEIWNKTASGQIRPVRYFDQDLRAIEYAPDDIQASADMLDWQIKYQLVSAKVIDKLKKIEEKNNGCATVHVYSGRIGTSEIIIEWLPYTKLVKYFSVKNPSSNESWTLTKQIMSAEKIAAVFRLRESYQSTDYADIGDNETDPFFQKIIKLGFISHGASGFYDDMGHPLDGDHHH